MTLEYGSGRAGEPAPDNQADEDKPLDGRREKIVALLQDLRRQGVDQLSVLRAVEAVPREKFIPGLFQAHAWDDSALPIGRDQTISQPSVVALMTQALGVDDNMKVLEIGTGSGYQSAILAQLCRRLYTIERHRPLLKRAEEVFRDLRIHNVTTLWGDGSRGWPEQAPFERILVTAAAVDVPPALADQLAPGGKMVLPMGDPDTFDQDVVCVHKDDKNRIHIEHLFPVRFVPLVAGTPDED